MSSSNRDPIGTSTAILMGGDARFGFTMKPERPFPRVC
jgi:hypothetical protein